MGQDDKITLILYTNVLHFQSEIQPRELAICAILFMYADMSQPSQRIFSPLTLSILKTIINLQKFSVQSCHHRHKGSYTGELHCLLLQPCRKPCLTRLREDIDACGMVVHSGLYIPMSSSIHYSWLDLVIISPVLALTYTHEP